MVNCCVVGCYSRSARKTAAQKQKERKRRITFHRFPLVEDLCKRWIDAVRRKNWTPHRQSVICSLHFTEDCFDASAFCTRLTKTAVPTIFSDCDYAEPLNPLEVVSVHMQTEESCTSEIQNKYSEAVSKPPMSNKPEAISFVMDTSEKFGESILSSKFQPTIKPQSELMRHLVSQTTSFSPDRRRTRTVSPTKAKLIEDYKFKLSSYKRKLKHLRQKNPKYRRTVKLELVLNDLKSKNFINEEIHYTLKNICCSYSEILERRLNQKNSYSPELKKFALTLHYYSPAAYSYVQRTFDSCLPDPQILTEWYQVANGDPGFTKESFEAVKLKMKSKDNKLLFSLVVDEMAIRRHVEYDGKNVYGYINFGMNDQNESIFIAKDVVVFLLVAINDDWKIPVGYVLTDGLSGSQRCNLVKQCLTLAFKSDIEIISITFQGTLSNLCMAELLGCQINPAEELTTWFFHEERKIYIFLDTCHVLRLIRNLFEEKKLLYTSSGAKISWRYIEELCNLQKEDLQPANKLRSQYISFQKHKTKIKLATQLFSQSLSDAIKICSHNLELKQFEGCEGTIEFVEKLNKLFDVLNSRSIYQIGYKKPINLVNAPDVFQFLSEMSVYLRGLKVTRDGLPLINTPRKTGIQGYLICIESITELYREICQEKQLLQYVPTHKFSLDHTELFFGVIRLHGKCNNDPTARQFMSVYKKLFIQTKLEESSSSYCTPLEHISSLQTADSLKFINMTSSRNRSSDNIDEENMNEITGLYLLDHNYSTNIDSVSEFSNYIVAYIAGFIVRSLSENITCEDCLNALYAENNMNLDNHNLISPSKDVANICIKCEVLLRKEIRFTDRTALFSEKFILTNSMQIWRSFLNCDIFKILKLHCLEQSPLDNHIGHLIKLISGQYFKIRLHYYAKSLPTYTRKDLLRAIYCTK